MAEDMPVCRLKFKCTASGHENVQEVVLPVSCLTVADLKRLIEKQFSIPSCVQSITFHNIPLSDTDSICPAYLSKDEILFVSFLSEADVSEVAEVVEWLRNLYAAVQRQSKSEMEGLMRQRYLFKNLTDNLFNPRDSGKKCVNKLYFDDCGGLDVLCSIYGIIVKFALSRDGWMNYNRNGWMDYNHRDFIESHCLKSIGNICQSAELSRRVIQLGGLDMCISTFLHINSLHEEALGTLWNMVEPVPEYHSVIAKDHDIILRIMEAIPRFSYRKANVALGIIMTCIAESVDRNPWTKEIILGLTKASQNVEDRAFHTPDQEMVGFRCYMAATLAMMIIPSPPRLLEEVDRTKIWKMMRRVVSTITPNMLQIYADQEMLTFLSHYPFIRLFYLPTLHSYLENPSFNKEYVFSMKVLLLVLHGILRRKVQFDILCKEQMLDYITVLPWILPGELSQAASNLISDLSSHQPLQPPTLLNIVKARFASWQFGLSAVRNTSVRDIVDVLSE